MKLRHLSGGLAAASALVAASPTAHADPVEPADECNSSAPPAGPYGWIDVFTACGSIQDSNEMIRQRNLLVRRSDGFEKYSFSPWTSCNNLIVQDSWDTDVWLWINHVVVDEPDTLADSC